METQKGKADRSGNGLQEEMLQNLEKDGGKGTCQANVEAETQRA
jgi:hypothetical protein